MVLWQVSGLLVNKTQQSVMEASILDIKLSPIHFTQNMLQTEVFTKMVLEIMEKRLDIGQEMMEMMGLIFYIKEHIKIIMLIIQTVLSLLNHLLKQDLLKEQKLQLI